MIIQQHFTRYGFKGTRLDAVAEDAGYPGRALSAYRRALEWILASDGEVLERAA